MNKSNIYKSITIIEDQQKVYKYLIFVLHLISKIASTVCAFQIGPFNGYLTLN